MLYIFITTDYKNGIISLFVTVLGLARDQNRSICCFLFSEGHTLCLVIVNSPINVFNALISFFWPWSVRLPARLSPSPMQLSSWISCVPSSPCFVHLQPVLLSLWQAGMHLLSRYIYLSLHSMARPFIPGELRLLSQATDSLRFKKLPFPAPQPL